MTHRITWLDIAQIALAACGLVVLIGYFVMENQLGKREVAAAAWTYFLAGALHSWALSMVWHRWRVRNGR